MRQSDGSQLPDPNPFLLPIPRIGDIRELATSCSSILATASVSRQLSKDIVERLKAESPATSVTYRDLAANPIPHLSGEYIAASTAAAGQHDGALQHDLAQSAAVLEEFLAADIVVVGVGMGADLSDVALSLRPPMAPKTPIWLDPANGFEAEPRYVARSRRRRLCGTATDNPRRSTAGNGDPAAG
ncbi:hypothetical protein B5P45_08505 [Phyllobacterium zundukense]|uniref:Flavodoxin-like fold domain-containing protein n=1 Tax=Phyllobacterium zundukense TaxID=1867719 RepID=A0A2N9W0M0_9HYPH|nr:hypothetical protein B5P45_08505 [Phyllobacterium zundukense]